MKPSRQFLSFCFVGAIGFLVDVAILYAVSPWFGWYAGRLISFMGAATVTWYLNRAFTFGEVADEVQFTAWQQYWRYIVAMLGGAFVNYVAYALTMLLITYPFAPALGIALGSVAGLAVNFVSAKKIIFNKKEKME